MIFQRKLHQCDILLSSLFDINFSLLNFEGKSGKLTEVPIDVKQITSSYAVFVVIFYFPSPLCLRLINTFVSTFFLSTDSGIGNEIMMNDNVLRLGLNVFLKQIFLKLISVYLYPVRSKYLKRFWLGLKEWQIV